tara:strand:- start:10948 stop:11178 length:231 start_codon:yes stop_codon:yes gene_type:complete
VNHSTIIQRNDTMDLTKISIIEWATIWLKSTIGALIASLCLASIPFVLALFVMAVGGAIVGASDSPAADVAVEVAP